MTSPWSSAFDLSQALKSRSLRSEQLCQQALERVRCHDSKIGAFLTVDADAILEQARAIDQRLDAGEALSPLAGIPVGIKDNLCVQGQETTAASKILSGYKPPYDAHVISALREAGAVLFGKLNLDEFAMGSSTENSSRQKTHNPWHLDYVPGGSSGGSAAAVAAGLLPLTLGSDTGGSIRQPAGLCGVTGLKPTYGRVSRFGLLAFASSLDQIGPMGRDARDLAILLQAIAGRDDRDLTSSEEPVPDYLGALENVDIGSMTIGLPTEFFEMTLDDEVRQTVMAAAKHYEAQGAKLVDVSLSLNKHAIACYQIVSTAEASSNLGRYDGIHYGHRGPGEDIIELMAKSRDEGFGDEVKRRIMLGTFVLSTGFYDAYYLKAQKVRRLIAEEYARAFEACDVLLTPASPIAGFKIGENMDDPLTMYAADTMTVSVNLVGVPGLVMPCGFSSGGLPIGLQLIGKHWSEADLLAWAWWYQQSTDFHTKHPEAFA